MKNVLTADEVRAAEAAVAEKGVDMLYLRMNAALAVVEEISDICKRSGVKTAVFCGGGGNGFDGVLTASRLFGMGCNVAVYLVGDGAAKKLGSSIAVAENAGVPILDASAFDGRADVVIDAIFGIGLNKEIEGETAELIERINGVKDALKIAVDIPSGLDPDTGEVKGAAVKADRTITFSCYKYGMLFGNGRDLCGDITVKEVGIPTQSKAHVFEDDDFKPYKRKRDAHKGTYGKVYVIGGSGAMIGAPVMAGAAAHAAGLNGAGTVTLCLPEIHRTAVAARSTLAMMKFLSDDKDGFIRFEKSEWEEIVRKADAINIGMGMGKCPDLKKIIEYLCAEFDGALVIDADGINALAGDYGVIKNAKPKIVITPHVGEFRRLTGEEATPDTAYELAKELGCIVVLKSATTVITDGKQIRLNVSGTPALAKGGSGDVLGGCITALACSFPLLDAATVACYRNGVGAANAVSSYSELMLTPKDILKYADYKELDD